MKATIRILSLCALLVPLSLLAKTEVNETLDAESDSLVKIEHTAGQAKISGWDKNQVSIEGTLGDDTEDYRFVKKGKTIEIIIETKKSRGGWSWGDGNIDGDDLVIFVPRGANVRYDTVNADVDIDDVHGGSELEVINGEINAQNLSGKLRLESVNGGIRGRDLKGDLSVEAVNGDIKVEHSSGDKIRVEAVNGDINFKSQASDVRVGTVNGDMEVDVSNIEDLNIETVNGSMDVHIGLLDGASVQASSVGGSIDLYFDANVQAKFDIEAHAGGRIKNRLSDDKMEKAKYGPKRWLKFSTGNPSATIDVSTVSGSILIAPKL